MEFHWSFCARRDNASTEPDSQQYAELLAPSSAGGNAGT